MHRILFLLTYLIIYKSFKGVREFHKIHALVAIHENRLNFFITYILSNTRFLISAKRLAFFWRWQSGWKLCLKINAIEAFKFLKSNRAHWQAAILHNG